MKHIEQNALHKYIHRELGTIANEQHLLDIEKMIVRKNGEQWNNAWLCAFVLLCLMFIGTSIQKDNSIAHQQTTIKQLTTRVIYTDAIIEHQHREITKANNFIEQNYPIQVTIKPCK